MGRSLDPGQGPVVVGLVGASGVGKTSLIERLIPALARWGLAVGAVKHASHGFLADRPGKDSYRLYESGADAVAVISREQLASFVRRPRRGEQEVTLAAALAALPPHLDLVLVEGFSWEPIPRVLMVPESGAPAREHYARGEVLGIVRVADPTRGERPVFSDVLIDSLVRELAARVPRLRDPRRKVGGAGSPVASLNPAFA